MAGTMWARFISISALAAAALFAQDTEWRSYGHDPGGMRYSTLTQINTGNVTRLARAWTFHHGETVASEPPPARHRIAPFEATPLYVDGLLYFTTPANRVIAVDGDSGRKIWDFDPQAGTTHRQFRQNRGVAWWQDASGRERRILYGTFEGHLIALDARTGKPCTDFGDNGRVDLRAGIADRWPKDEYDVTSAPAIYKDLVIVGAEVPEYPSLGPAGDVRAFDVRTGKLRWTFHTIPRPGEPGHDTWTGDSWRDRTGANVWSTMSVDTRRGLVFLPVGSASYDFWGGDRKGADLYGNSVVALDAATGKLRWYYQLVHHDVWDYDPPAQPVLATVRHNGHNVDAVVQLTKMGLVFVLDRDTGKPLFPVEERRVPQSDVPGEQTWPTQPVPVKPPPLSRTSITRADITTVTPELHKYCMDVFNRVHNSGLFTPYGRTPTVVFPGTLGGATWSGGAFDPRAGLLFVNVNNVGALGHLVAQPPGSPVPYRRTASVGGEYARFWDQEHHWPCQQPPWGTLNAVNLNTGDIAWTVPLGVVDELEAKGVHNTGAPNLGGAIVTAGGLVFIAGTNDHRFRAFDARTGKMLWETQLEASGHATPMTYQGRDGRQYVVIAAGGGNVFSNQASDVLAAYALPK